MKKQIKIKIPTMVILALFCQLFAVAQPNDRPRPPKGRHMPSEGFVKDLKIKLNLTSEQETKIQKIFDEQREETEKMFESEKKAQESKQEEMKKERDAMRNTMEEQQRETNEKISAVLTVEQKKKFEEFLTEQLQRPPRMPKHEGGHDRPMREECRDHLE